ncbi:THUMP-like domain-containing protein [Saccharothrix obliqua]|uniref:THUMP-like domain-containing protein n=1 Tax=Saccharothrix obliqua TaxID=2861747 RepID=UPI001C5EFEAC|nr:class I SAM-dependent methyltransferase [Saccharothrix obliqua]MBW4716542.1 class I SAM-dependent methyltransferase [Saccharothrix obliqua]
MGYRFGLDDVEYLRSAAGAEALAAVGALPLADGDRIADVAFAKRLSPDHHAAVLETVLLRRRAAGKVPFADGLFTADAVQQATAWPVAAHRAERFAGRVAHDVTCSVGADLAALPAGSVGSDLDPVRLAMARHNLGDDVPLVRADALRPVTRDVPVLADPARRDATGRRTWRPADFAPPLDELAAACAGRDLAVKCAPGVDFAVAPWADEVELVSLDGQVREACLWTRGLATPGVTRRATVLRTGGPKWTITDAEPDDCPVTPPAEWLVDPDGAVVRAGLVRHYAARHGLAQLDERIAYLTGPQPPPGIRAFRVVAHGHYAEKSLRAVLRAHDVGRLEILVRGLDVDPNALRRRLKPSGAAEATVVLTRIGRTPTYLLAHAERT